MKATTLAVPRLLLFTVLIERLLHLTEPSASACSQIEESLLFPDRMMQVFTDFLARLFKPPTFTCIRVLSCKRESSRRFFSGPMTNRKSSDEKKKTDRSAVILFTCYLLLIVSKPSRAESKSIKRRQRQSGVDTDFTCWDENLSITDVTQQLPDVGLRSDG